MKTYRLIAAVGTLLCASLLSSCTDMLTEDPNSAYKKDKFFTSNGNAQLAITGIFDVLSITSHYGGNETVMPCSDDTYYMQGTNSDNIRRDIAHYQMNPTNTWLKELWDHKYKGIDRANYAIAGIEAMPGYKDDKELINFVAQARFLRAFLAFDLIKYWGDVPFKTTPTELYTEAFGPRVSREVIYDQIISDLNFAKETLPWATASTSPEAVTQGAARGMLMRVLMQRAGYSLQIDGTSTRPDDATRTKYFEAVIDEYEAFRTNGKYHDFYSGGYTEQMKTYSSGRSNSQESLWEIAFYTPNGAINDGSTWGTYIGPLVAAPGVKPTEKGHFMGRANAFYRVVPEWKDFFEDTDERRDVMVCTYQYKWDAKVYNHVKTENKAGKDWYPGKWRREWMPLGFIDPNNVDVNFCPLRYADVVLMAAEAFNETNKKDVAWVLLNFVRTRSGATAITTANYTKLLKAPKVLDLPFIADGDDKGRFRTALYWERGFELAFEGQRKYDLIRWGIMKEALDLMGSTTSLNKGVSDSKLIYPAYKRFIKGKHELFPIPLSELQSNPKLENRNNNGY